MSPGRRILHLVRSETWPEELREVGEAETVVILGGAEVPGGCSGRVLDLASGPGALLDRVFEHDVVLTW